MTGNKYRADKRIDLMRDYKQISDGIKSDAKMIVTLQKHMVQAENILERIQELIDELDEQGVDKQYYQDCDEKGLI